MKRKIEFYVFDRDGKSVRTGVYNGNNAVARKKMGGLFSKAIDENYVVVTGKYPLPVITVGDNNGESKIL